jgi:hypothetical protein
MSMRPRTSSACALSSSVFVADSVVCAHDKATKGESDTAPRSMAAANGRIAQTLFIPSLARDGTPPQHHYLLSESLPLFSGFVPIYSGIYCFVNVFVANSVSTIFPIHCTEVAIQQRPSKRNEDSQRDMMRARRSSSKEAALPYAGSGQISSKVS